MSYLPKFSIIIPAYNVAPWIEQTLNSVKNQTYNNYECIIVDDNSTDNTLNIIYYFTHKNSRFRVIHNKKNMGQGACRNIGLHNAQGEYVAFLDSDDIWHSTFLETMYHIINTHNIWLAYSRYIMFFDKTNIYKPQIWENVLKTGNILWDMLAVPEFHLCSCVCKTCIARQIGGFNSNMSIAEDRDFLLRLLFFIYKKNTSKIYGTKKILYYYRQRDNSTIHILAKDTISTELKVMHLHLNNKYIPRFVRKRGYSFLALKFAIINLHLKNYLQTLLWYLKAVYYDPLNINLLWLPCRKILLGLTKIKHVYFN